MKSRPRRWREQRHRRPGREAGARASLIWAKVFSESTALRVAKLSNEHFAVSSAGAQLGYNLIMGKGRTGSLSRMPGSAEDTCVLCVPMTGASRAARPVLCRKRDSHWPPRALGPCGEWDGRGDPGLVQKLLGGL